jgi:CMP/dCMP kinase
MTASVVTFSHQIGSNGAQIARSVADKLRYRYYDWEVISQAAAAAGVSPEVIAVAAAERPPNLLERMMRRLAAASTDADEDTPAPPVATRASVMTSDDYRQFIEQVVKELGSQGDAVIVGHAGQAILRDAPGVLKVLLVGSQAKRSERIAAAQGVSTDQALSTVRNSDRQRADFFKRAYHLDWLDASRYDVALSTDRLSVELARDMIVAMAREVP